MTDYPKRDYEQDTKTFFEWKGNKDEDILHFRDKQHTSGLTGVTGSKLATTWVE
jgi:hypothetical protein